MARVVYGISGEGSGHASRARVVLSHLRDCGHEIRSASYDRGYRDLSADFDVLEIEGLHIASSENRVSLVETFTGNLARIPEGVGSVKALRRLFDDFRPHCVITDFEPMTAYLAGYLDLPLVTIDNQHRMRYMRYACPAHLKKDALVTETVIRAMVPRPDVSLVTTFYLGEPKNDRTFLFPPILRPEVRAATACDRGHVLVYLTQGYESLLDRLRPLDRETFVVYGYDRDESAGNLRFRPFSRNGFLEDLASCAAVIATAGFTLMTESLHLQKPMLALPMAGQFEQELNALLLAETGCGMNGRELTDSQVAEFLYRLPDYRQRLVELPRTESDEALLTKLDALLDRDAEQARQCRERRRSR